jgi:hypothetical protein
MYYSINGKLLKKDKKNESKISDKYIYENFADEPETKDDNGLALLGNLSLDGIVSAKGFYLPDGSKTPEVVKLPDNVSLDGKKMGINVKKPKSDLHMKGKFFIEGDKGQTTFNSEDGSNTSRD